MELMLWLKLDVKIYYTELLCLPFPLRILIILKYGQPVIRNRYLEYRQVNECTSFHSDALALAGRDAQRAERVLCD